MSDDARDAGASTLDLAAMKDLGSWRVANGPNFSLLDYLYGTATLEQAAAFTALFWPDTVVHQGGVFLKERFSQERFESWLAAYGGDLRGVQLSMNRLVLGDTLPGIDDMSDANLHHLATTIADMWDSRLAKLHPGLAFEIAVFEVNLDLAVTFAARTAQP
jgi:hypothetical protein